MELTKFEICLLSAFNSVAGKAVMTIGTASFEEDVDEWSKPLLDIAKKELEKDLPKLRKQKPKGTVPYFTAGCWYLSLEDFEKLPKEE